MDELKNFLFWCTVGLVILVSASNITLVRGLRSVQDKILEAIEDQPAYVEQTQPPVEDDILCYDFATGHVYSAFVRDDGNVQLRINPEGNLVIAKLIEHEMPTEVKEE